MKKVLIISYFFPPCNLTASQRAFGWSKYLKKYGYKPIVVTRSWDNNIKFPEDVLTKSGAELRYEKTEDFEVYQLPYRPGIRDKIFTQFSGNPLQNLSKPLTIINEFISQYSTVCIPHRNMFVKAEQIIKEQGITKMIISGNPFDQFFFGYLLNKRTGVKWIADYRDDWTTSELKPINSFPLKLISKFHKRNEKKWVKTASFVTSISPYYTKKISDFVNVRGETLLNGYDVSSYDLNVSPVKEKFTITYNGSLYPTQPIEHFIEAFKELVLEKEVEIPIFLNFPGLAYDKIQLKRVKDCLSGMENNYRITKRIPREEVIKMQLESDLVLMISHKNLKGIPSSKLYEYIGLERPILLYPNEGDILEQTLSKCGLGVICNSKKEIKSKLLALIKKKIESKNLLENINYHAIKEFSRENQTKNLAKLLNRL